jgi:hypothetical protein
MLRRNDKDIDDLNSDLEKSAPKNYNPPDVCW